jgi:hypothetical protein
MDMGTAADCLMTMKQARRDRGSFVLGRRDPQQRIYRQQVMKLLGSKRRPSTPCLG